MTWRPTVIVVPCYNERARLDIDAFSAHARFDSRIGFLFVDDGSTDGTGALLEATTLGSNSLRWMRSDENRGKGEAVRAGLLEALAGEPEVVGYWDADLSTPLREVTPMVDALLEREGRHAVIGARVKLLGRRIDRHPLRHYLGRAFATVAALILRMPVYDTQCGAKVFRATPALERIVRRPFRSRWIFDVELLDRMQEELGPPSSGWIEEHPLRRWQDVRGSKLGPGDFLAATRDLVRIGLTRRKPRPRPTEAPGGPRRDRMDAVGVLGRGERDPARGAEVKRSGERAEETE